MVTDLNQERKDSASSNRHLDLAYSHVLGAWLPVNRELLNKLRNDVHAGRFDGGRDELIGDLKQDFALFLHCVRKLAEKRSHAKAGSANVSAFDPFELIEQASVDELKSIFNASEGAISSHRYSDMSELQGQRLKHCVISSSVAETISAGHGVDSDLAFSCSLFRQLGLTLIAWNYPHVYKRALSTLKADEKLDIVLSRTLGFSPTLLAIKLAREWGLSSEIRLGMGDTSVLSSDLEQGNLRFAGETLDKICEVGEALARASDPEHYPSASHDWEEAKNEIQRTLGKDGMRVIQEKLTENCKSYSKLLPDVFGQPAEMIKPLSLRSSSEGSRALLQNNPYLRHCPEHLQSEIKNLYSKMDGVTISREVIDKLCKQIMPQSGFVRGCIYLIEPDSLHLVPRLVVGTVPLGRFKAVRYLGSAIDYDPVAAAFNCRNPIMEENVVINDQNVSYVAGVLGDMQKAGVLYLEIADFLLRDRNLNVNSIYKALRQTLNDALNLR